MSKIDFKYPPSATPLDPNETTGLIPDYITTQGELNELEGKNIENALLWLHRRKKNDILNMTFVFELHKHMFGEVWRWAGKQRTSNKNIGVMAEQIMNQLGVLFKDTEYWIEHKTFPWDEIGIRFHYRLVAIHIFPNGNGRHARIMTDFLLELNNQDSFSWGANLSTIPIDVEGPTRDSYISALKSADRGDYDALLKFARS